MNLLLSDIALPISLPRKKENQYIDLSKLKIKNCVGCFGCWVKTPGKCVIRDDATKVYPLIAKSEKIIYVTHLYCGSYDVTMKTLLERAIPIQQAFIRLHDKETHHVQRDVVEKDAVILAYGAELEEEKKIFEQLVERNAKNMSFKSWKLHFVMEKELNEVIVRKVMAWENC